MSCIYGSMEEPALPDFAEFSVLQSVVEKAAWLTERHPNFVSEWSGISDFGNTERTLDHCVIIFVNSAVPTAAGGLREKYMRTVSDGKYNNLLVITRSSAFLRFLR